MRKNRTRIANSLLNKIQRYADSSVLFRQAEAHAALLPGTMPVASSSPVAKAVIFPPGQKGDFAEAVPAVSEPHSSVTDTTVKPTRVTDAVVPAQRPADFAAGVNQTRPTPVSPAKMPGAEPDTAVSPSPPSAIQQKPEPSTERNWSRLETIMRLHKEKQEVEEGAASSEATTTNVDTAVSPPTPPKSPGKTDVTSLSVGKESGSVQLSPAGEPPKSADQPIKSVPASETSGKTANVPPAEISAANETEISAVTTDKREEMETAVPTKSSQTFAPEKQHPTAETMEQTPVMRQPAVQPDQAVGEISPDVSPADEMMAAATEVETEASENMPVQKEEQAITQHTHFADVVHETREQDAISESETSTASGNVVAMVPENLQPTAAQPVPLQAVWAVESVGEEGAAPPTTPLTATSPTVPPATVQRQPLEVDTAVQDRLAAVPPGMPTDSSVPLLRPLRPRPSQLKVREETAVTQEPTAQRQEEETVTAPPAPEPQRVTTQIGDLPEDLWHLIGQEPPAPPKEDKQTEIADASLLSPTAVTPQTPIVQREPEPTSEPESSETGPDEEGGGEKEESEIDTDKLARQVYSDIKQRLAVEWERMRGRYQ